MVIVILGIIMLLAGAGCWIYGSYMSRNVMLLLDALVTHGMLNPGGIWKTGGGFLILGGIVLLVLGAKSGRGGFSRKKDDDEDDLDDDQFDPDDDFD